MRLRLLISLISLMSGALCASESPDTQCLARWLSLTTEQRLAERRQIVAQAHQAGAELFATSLAAETASDPAATERLKRLTSDDPVLACWFDLQAARHGLRNGQAAAVIDQLLELRDSAPSMRLRYEVLLTLIAVLDTRERQAEAQEVRQEAADLVRRDLYAEQGLDPIPEPRLVPVTAEDDLRRRFETASRYHDAGDLDAATVGYQDIADRAPLSEWATRSWIGLGWCDAQRARLDQGEARWQSVIRKQPDAPWSGQAMLALVDVALADRLDPVLAEHRLAALITALTRHVAGADDSWDALRVPVQEYQVILALVAGNADQAQAIAQRLLGDPAHGVPRSQDPGDPNWRPASGIAKLIERIASGRPLTPDAALDGKFRVASMHLLLADAWREADRTQRSVVHLARVRDQRMPASPAQRVYARMRQADLAYIAGIWPDFRNGYVACLEEQPRNPWAAWQLLCLGVDAYSRRHDEQDALDRFQAVVTTFPDDPCASTAQWYRGVIALWGGRWRDADQYWRELNRRWPNHPWRSAIAAHYRPWLQGAIARGIKPADIAQPVFAPAQEPQGP